MDLFAFIVTVIVLGKLITSPVQPLNLMPVIVSGVAVSVTTVPVVKS